MAELNYSLIQKLLKVFYQLLYHQFAWSYNLVAWIVSAGQWKRWVSSTLPFLGTGKILELGHGPGQLQTLTRSIQLDITGLDLSPQMGKICQRRLQRSGFLPKLVTATGSTLPFKPLSFSTVAATFPTDYILQPETLSEIRRVLKDQGQLVVLPLAWNTGKGPIFKFSAWLFKITGQNPAPDHPGFESGYQIIRDAGFIVETQIVPLKHSKVFILVARK